MSNRRESQDTRYARLLASIEHANGEFMRTGPDDSPEDVTAYAELTKCGAIEGKVVRYLNQPMEVDFMIITAFGRQMLADLRYQAEGKTSLGFLKQNRMKILYWLLNSTIAGAVGWYARSFLK